MFSSHIDHASGRGHPTRRRTARALIVPVVTVALVACSGSDSVDEASINPPPTTPTTTSATTPAPTLATTLATTPVTTPVTTPATTATAVGPTTTEPLPPALPRGEPLSAATTYRIARSALGRSAQITNTIDGARGQSGQGGFVLTADEIGFEPMVGGFDLAKARFFIDPLVDAYAMLDDQLTAATTEPTTDFLVYFAALPGVEAGEITDVEFAGHPARAMSWAFGAFEGGVSCAPGGNCVNAVWLPRWISSYLSGDSGTTYVLDLDGQTLIVEVQDRAGAQEAAESLVIGD